MRFQLNLQVTSKIFFDKIRINITKSIDNSVFFGRSTSITSQYKSQVRSQFVARNYPSHCNVTNQFKLNFCRLNINARQNTCSIEYIDFVQNKIFGDIVY